MAKAFLFCAATLFLTLFAAKSSDARLFKVSDGNGTCILLDIDFQLSVMALNSSAEVDTVKYTQADNITVDGDCDVPRIGLTFMDNLRYDFFFLTNEPDYLYLSREVKFIPSEVFGATEVPIADQKTLHAHVSFNLGTRDTSYTCSVPKSYNYTDTPVIEVFSFQASGLIEKIHAQGVGVKNGKFSPATDCTPGPPMPTEEPRHSTMPTIMTTAGPDTNMTTPEVGNSTALPIPTTTENNGLRHSSSFALLTSCVAVIARLFH